MNDYYEILGVNPEASQMEIKKAYFKMIRKYSPESDPEQFQKIREAYEQLGKAQNLSEGPSFPSVRDPWAAKMLKQIEQYRRIGDMEACRDTCEEAWRIFPEEIQFLYWLVIAQRQCGNTGKAVKNAEKLVGKEPKNMWFQKELALSYMARGFTQKAYYACENAYELGCRDIDFTLTYAVECAEYGQYDRGIQILFEVVRQEKQWSKEEMPELTDAYMGLLKMNKDAEGIYLQEIMERLGQMLEKYSIYAVEYVPEIAMMLACTCVMEGNSEADYQKVEYLYGIMRKICHTEEEKELVDEAAKEFHYQRFANDPRIGATLKRGYEAYYDLAELDESLMKFALTDTQLCMVEEREEILKQAEIIRQEYPDYYMKLESFIQKLKSEKNLVYLKDSLQKTYRRMEPNFDGGYYYELYPQEKRRMQGVLLHDGLEEDTYVRSTKKIGRNDPCPCGSGKKYKHCCMNK